MTAQAVDRAEFRTDALEAFVAGCLRRQPVTATFAGVHDHDHRLPDWSPDGLAAAAEDRRRVRRRLQAAGFGDRPELPVPDWPALDGALALAWLDIEDAEDASEHFVRGNPSLAVGESLFALVSLAWEQHRPIRERSEAAAARVAAIPAFLEGVRLTIGDRAIPAAWKERAWRECDAGGDLLADLEAWLAAEGADAGARRAFAAGATRAAAGLASFAAWLASRPDATDSRYAAGGDLLALLLRRGHWCETSVADLQHEARAAMDDERRRLHARLEAAGVSGWPEMAERLASDHPSPEAVLAACRSAWAAAREAADGQVTWPGLEVRYEAMPAWARRAAPRLYYLLYRSPAPFRYPAFDRYAVPVPAPDEPAAAQRVFVRAWNRSAITLNHVVHHGGLGHHVQNWHAARSASRVGRMAAVDGANRIASLLGGSMAEGWACHAAGIMERLGGLTPDEQVAEQHTRLRLAVRAVADLELHSGRLSFDQAVQLHEQVSGLGPAAARNEVVKCSMFPGTALMYWLGARALRRLRQEEEGRLGRAFDARAFHDRVLSMGSIPVSLVADVLRAERVP